MSAPSKVNKENFRLLDMSSDEESEDLQLEIIPSRKKKITRRERSRSVAPQPSEPNFGAEVQCALRWAIRGTLLLWLLMLTWICAGLYDHVSTMRSTLAQFSTSSTLLNDELQVCHTTAKELRSDATDFKNRLDKLEQQYSDLVLRVNKATKEFEKVTDQLSAAPQLADTPKQLADLQRTVADIGSQISGFDAQISSAKKQVVTAVSGVEEIRTSLHQLDAKANETVANVTAAIHREDDLKNAISALNTTINAKVDILQNRIQELSKPVSTMAPTVPSPVTSASTAATSTTAAPAASTHPGPPAKPPVLQSVDTNIPAN